MKRIIDGKRYDTETAERVTWVGSRSGISRSDFTYWDAAIYRTPRGRWFLSGDGGPASIFAKSVGNATTGGSGIIPISDGEALRYLEDVEAMDALEQHFAIEEDNMADIHGARDRALHRAVHQYGDRLRIANESGTVTTLQGMTEACWVVWGRAHGGDYLGCVFPNRRDARDAIAKARGGA